MRKKKSILDKLYQYDKKNNAYKIDIALSKYEDIYNEWDPTPFKKRDIEEEFIKYVIDSSCDIPLRYNLDLRLYLSKSKMDESKEKNVKIAIKSYFNYLLDRNKKELLDSLRRVIRAFITSIVLLGICYIPFPTDYMALVGNLVKDGIGILGWVAMWNVGEEFLFRIINRLNERKNLKRLFVSKVEFIYR